MNDSCESICTYKSRIFSSFIGGLLGIGVSFVVNSALAEISKNRAFAFVRDF
jgi:hypothetical protein